ncbi:hypothetical protein BC832DRAFT_551910 [Gaertneriomyces semiglobifer]|nr:hypothetical protein BC832DRAFT_551910 [Gaertneriomyces semiglobifer]
MQFTASVPAGVYSRTASPSRQANDGNSNASAPLSLNVVVEPTAALESKDGETFLTQRGGKIIQQPVPVLPNDHGQSLLQARNTLQSTLLLQKKKEMQAIQDQLDKRRAEFAKRMEACREKQEELIVKQKQIRDRVTKFEKFLKENDAKRQRANLKAQTEIKLREQKEQELASIQRQLHNEQIKHAHILQLIKKYQVYEQYLQSVVEILPPEYLDVNEPHINDILMRHKTLIETNEDLMGTVQQSQDEIERQQAALVELVKEKNDLILVYNSTLGTQQKRLDRLKQECAFLEQRLEERDNTGKERMRMLGETKLAINNIYDRVGLRPHKIQAAPAVQPPVLGRKTSVLPEGVPLAPAASQVSVSRDYADNSAKALSDRLHAIQERVLDLQHIAQRAEQFVAQDRSEKAKKQQSVSADAPNVAAGHVRVYSVVQS